MPTEYTLLDLAKLADVTPRTIRYYIAQGLLPAPTQSGPAARYSENHLDLLRVIKRLQAGHLPLAEIRTRLRALPQDALRSVAAEPVNLQVADSAIDYINRVLRRPTLPPAMPTPAPAPAPLMARSFAAQMPEPPEPPATPNTAPTPPPAEPDRAQWERITLDPDIELHIRRPLTRHQNKRVERLISIARQLLEED